MQDLKKLNCSKTSVTRPILWYWYLKACIYVYTSTSLSCLFLVGRPAFRRVTASWLGHIMQRAPNGRIFYTDHNKRKIVGVSSVISCVVVTTVIDSLFLYCERTPVWRGVKSWLKLKYVHDCMKPHPGHQSDVIDWC